jgi:hypothetical protein
LTEVHEGFHARGGWYFRREADGSVRILAPDSLGPGAHQVVTLDPNTWASVVASVSARGDNVNTFIAAHHLHQDEPPAAPAGDAEQAAQAAYRAYGEHTGGLNHRGEPMPVWEDLGDTIRGAWLAATTAVADRVKESEK